MSNTECWWGCGSGVDVGGGGGGGGGGTGCKYEEMRRRRGGGRRRHDLFYLFLIPPLTVSCILHPNRHLFTALCSGGLRTNSAI